MKPSSSIVLDPGRKGRPDFALRVDGGTVWLTQADIADLFGTTTANVNIHIRNILKESELQDGSVIKESLITGADGKNCHINVERMLEFNERSIRRGAERPAAAKHLRVLREKSGELEAQKRAPKEHT